MSVFRNWIDSVGPKNIAKKLHVTRSAVYYWRNGDRLPTLRYAEKLKKLSRGKIDFKQMLDHYHSLQ